jgi:hypothetical protein
MPALTGDCTTSAGAVATTCTKTGGVAFTTNSTAAVGQLPGTTTNDNASTGKVGEFVNSACTNLAATVTITIAAPAVITWTAHGISNSFGGGACPVIFTTTGALPTGITSGTTYYMVPSSITTNTFQIATTVANALAGTSITTTGTQSGTQTGTQGVSLTSGTPANVTGISLTAGDYDVWGMINSAPAGSTVVSLNISNISTTSATAGGLGLPGRTDCAYGAGITGGNSNSCIVTPTRISILSTTTVFLVEDSFFSTSTLTSSGFISARRVR